MQLCTRSTVCIALLLVTAGCTGVLDDGSSGPSDTEALQRDTVDAMEDVETYHADMEMNISVKGREVTVTQDGVYDLAEQKARFTTTFGPTETTAYLDGKTMYMQSRDEWRTRELTQTNPWTQGQGLALQQQLLESAEVSLDGTETLDGVETTVLSVDPKESQVKQLLARQGQQLSGVSIEEVRYTMYVSTETERPRRIDMTMTFTANGQEAEANVTMTFSKYDEPVDITIPENATQSLTAAATVAPAA